MNTLKVYKVRLRYRAKLINIEIKYHMRFLTNKRISKNIRLKQLFCIVFRKCPQCFEGWAYIKHSNCAYWDELLNYNFCCLNCHSDIDRQYQDMWDDYYSGRL